MVNDVHLQAFETQSPSREPRNCVCRPGAQLHRRFARISCALVNAIEQLGALCVGLLIMINFYTVIACYRRMPPASSSPLPSAAAAATGTAATTTTTTTQSTVCGKKV